MVMVHFHHSVVHVGKVKVHQKILAGHMGRPGWVPYVMVSAWSSVVRPLFGTCAPRSFHPRPRLGGQTHQPPRTESFWTVTRPGWRPDRIQSTILPRALEWERENSVSGWIESNRLYCLGRWSGNAKIPCLAG